MADSSEELAELGAELHRVRIQAGRTQADVGRQAKISRQLVSRIENGRNGDIAAYLAVARTLERRVALVETAPSAGVDPVTAADPRETHVAGESDDNLKILLDSLFSYVALLDIDGVVKEVNQAPLVRAGYRYEDVIGQYFYDAPWWSYDSAVQSQLIAAIEAARTGKISRYEVIVKMGDDLTPIDFQISPAYGRDGAIFGLLATAVDISERKKVEEEKSYVFNLAYNDMLTGLPNRRLFHDRLDQEIKQGERNGTCAVLILIDLDHFKEINDTLGHEVGDALLIEVANRLRECLRDQGTVARMGGDEFSVILSPIDSFDDVSSIAQSIIVSLSAEYEIMGKNLFVSASAGIAAYPVDATDSSNLIRYADQALYQAKSEGRRRFSLFTSSMQEESEKRARLASELRYALPGGQLAIYYQPIVRLSTGVIEKAESLLRWNHPAYGFIPPSEFIPVAEETGLIHEIGDWVFESAVREAKRCCVLTGPNFQISVNKSPVQFRGRSEKSDPWLDKLEELEISGKNIVIEITEGLMLNNDAMITDRFLRYHDAGIQIAVDDFGTGYSAMSYLKKFDIDHLKIDQSFVHSLTVDSTGFILTEAIVAMAHKLGLTVIAEGVETDEQLDLLLGIGCDYGQGYLFSPPVPADVFEELLVDAHGIAHAGRSRRRASG